MRLRPVSVSLVPNLRMKDVLISLKYLISPVHWFYCKKGPSIKKAKDLFSKTFDFKHVYLVDKARNAIYLSLKALGIQKGDEVIIQAYTCVVVPNSVIWAGGIPVYADIDPKTLNMDVNQLESLITPKTKAIMVQHNFGLAVDMNKIREIAKKHSLIIIEDCAHSLGTKYNNKYVGHFGDIAIFTFGRDKVISSVNGGAIALNNNDLAKKITKEYEKLKPPSYLFIIRSLLHSISFAFILPLYRILIGKILLVFLQKVGLLEKVYHKNERIGGGTMLGVYKMPNCLAEILINQIKLLDQFNNHRKKIAQLYFKELQNINNLTLPIVSENHIYFRYTLLKERPEKLIKYCKKHGFLLGNWYEKVIVPKQVNLDKVYYEPGQCPVAEKTASQSVNLPNSISTSSADAYKLTKLIIRFFSQK